MSQTASSRQLLFMISDWLDQNPKEALEEMKFAKKQTEANIRLSSSLKKQIADESKTLNAGSRIAQ